MKVKYRNIAFLAELLINIFVFSISCAILVGLFGRASLMARQTKEKNFASAEMYTIFETMKVRGTSALTVSVDQGEGHYHCYYDHDWQPSVSDEWTYAIYLTVEDTDTGAGVLRQVSAVARNTDGEDIYQMETRIYQSGQGGGSA